VTLVSSLSAPSTRKSTFSKVSILPERRLLLALSPPFPSNRRSALLLGCSTSTGSSPGLAYCSIQSSTCSAVYIYYADRSRVLYHHCAHATNVSATSRRTCTPPSFTLPTSTNYITTTQKATSTILPVKPVHQPLPVRHFNGRL
jgi:hypothetical protein